MVDDLKSCFLLLLLLTVIGGGSQSSNIESVDARSRFLPSLLSEYTFENLRRAAKYR